MNCAAWPDCYHQPFRYRLCRSCAYPNAGSASKAMAAIVCDKDVVFISDDIFCKDKPIYRAEQRIAGFFSTSVADLLQWPLLEAATATKTEVPFAMHVTTQHPTLAGIVVIRDVHIG